MNKKCIEDGVVKIIETKNINSFKGGLGGNLQYYKVDFNEKCINVK